MFSYSSQCILQAALQFVILELFFNKMLLDISIRCTCQLELTSEHIYIPPQCYFVILLVAATLFLLFYCSITRHIHRDIFVISYVDVCKLACEYLCRKQLSMGPGLTWSNFGKIGEFTKRNKQQQQYQILNVILAWQSVDSLLILLISGILKQSFHIRLYTVVYQVKQNIL